MSERCRACGDYLASDEAAVDTTGGMLCSVCERRFGPQPLVARFWHDGPGGWVKLTLHVRVDFVPKPFPGPYERRDGGGQSVAERLHQVEQDAAREAHDDGSVTFYSYTSNDEGGGSRVIDRIWLEENGAVHLYRDTWSRDCDGVMTSEIELSCHVSRLAAREPYQPDPAEHWSEDTFCPVPGAKLPEWRTRSSRQRDLQAEAAGY